MGWGEYATYLLQGLIALLIYGTVVYLFKYALIGYAMRELAEIIHGVEPDDSSGGTVIRFDGK